MKYGVHAGHSVDSIINRKRADFEAHGRIYWGYGGTICHPLKQIQPFTEQAMQDGEKVYLALSRTNSALYNPQTQSSLYSVNGSEWYNVPKDMEIFGSRYAIICRELVRCSFEINTSAYLIGVGINRGKNLSQYLKGRVDKACAFYKGSEHNDEMQTKTVKIDYIAEIVEPYAVFLK